MIIEWASLSAVEAHFVINLVGEEATPKEAATNNNVQINITRQEQGMYVVQYMTTHAMFYKANISLDGRPIMDSPFELEVFPGPVYPYGCYAEGKTRIPVTDLKEVNNRTGQWLAT